MRAHGAQGVGATVGVEEHRQRPRAVVVLGQHERRGEAPHAVERERDARREVGHGGERLQRDAVERVPRRGRLAEGGGAHHDRRTAGGRRVHAGLVGERLERTAGTAAPDVQHRGVVERVGEEHDAVGAGRHHGAHLEIGRRHRNAVDGEAAGAAEVGARQQRPARSVAGHAGHELDPRVVAVGPALRGGARRGVDRRHLHRALVAGLRGDEQPRGRPVHLGEVRELARGPTPRR